MKVKLLHATPLSVAIHATRTCYDSFDKSDDGGEKDQALMNRVIVSHNHGSVYEHCHFNFFLEGVTRGTLQELVRHRHSFQDIDFPEWDGRDWSPSVRSSRYTLKELKNEKPFYEIKTLSKEDSVFRELYDITSAKKYIDLPKDETLMYYAIHQLEILRKAISDGYKNDEAKDLIPDCYLTDITMTINGRSLRNLIKLRTSKSAYWRIRDLAQMIYDAIPEEHKFLFDDVNQGE